MSQPMEIRVLIGIVFHMEVVLAFMLDRLGMKVDRALVELEEVKKRQAA